MGQRYDAPASHWSKNRTRSTTCATGLRRAVDGEQFELAAELRDRIKALETETV
ncbi:UvrB/UvrC motif-containing protein [Gemmatimonas sp.]|uniref:UvrB/UvrC motif-containing protein n=1 Tax=Gemmatimonas sp. TaxID=1962908 RepID=UPI003DA52835